MRAILILLAFAACTAMKAQTSIAGVQYWFNQDHQDTAWISNPGGTNMEISTAIDVSALPLGTHYLRMRLKDSNGRWSSVIWRMFTIDLIGPNQLQLLRYWSQQASQDPSDMVEVPFSTPTQLVDIQMNLDFCTFSQAGTTRAFFQLRDARNQWSSVIARDINIDVVGQAPHIIVIDGPDVVQIDTEYTYTASSVGGSSYAWTLPDGWTLLSSTGNSITVLSPGETMQGTFEVVASNLCGESATPGILDVSFTGVSVNEQRTGFRVYPNPTSGSITLELDGTTAPAEARLYDLNGRSLSPAFRLDGADRHVLDLSGQASGMYVVRIMTPTEVSTVPIILQR